MTAKEFCEKHKVAITHASAPLRKDDEKGSFRYVVTVNFAGKAHPDKVFDYWKGSAHVGYLIPGDWVSGEIKNPATWKRISFSELKRFERGEYRFRPKPQPIPPQANEVLYSLAMGAQCIRDYPIWEDFANSGMGYNVDSIKDKKIFEACTESYLKLRAIFGQTILNELMSVEDE